MVRIISKYKSLNSSVRMSFWFLMCSFLQKAIGFITTPIFTRIMISEEYGRYSTYISWNNIIAVFVTLSISGNCFTRGLIIHEDKRDEFSSSLQGLVTTCVFAWMVLFLLFSEFVQNRTGITPFLTVFLFLELLLTNAYNFFYNRKRVELDYRIIVVLTVLFAIFRPLISIIAIKCVDITHQVEARAVAIVLVNAVLFLPLYFSVFLKGKSFFNKEYWKYALLFCIPLIPHYLSSVVLNSSDRIMISHYIGNTEAAYYSVAYTLAGVMGFFNTAVAQSFDPWIYRSLKEKSLDRIAPVSYKILMGILGVNLLVILMAPELLIIIAPKDYSNALYAIPPVTISVFFTFMYNLFATFQFYYKKTKWIALGSSVGAILNIVLNAIFIPQFGYVAAGYTTLVCYILFGVFHYYYMRRVCNEMLDGYAVYDIRIVFGIGLLLIVLSAITVLLYPFWAVRYCIFALILIIIFIRKNAILGLFNNSKR